MEKQAAAANRFPTIPCNGLKLHQALGFYYYYYYIVRPRKSYGFLSLKHSRLSQIYSGYNSVTPAFRLSARLTCTARATAFSLQARASASTCATACIFKAAGGISRRCCVAAVAGRVPSRMLSSALRPSLSLTGRKSCGAASQSRCRFRKAAASAAWCSARALACFAACFRCRRECFLAGGASGSAGSCGPPWAAFMTWVERFDRRETEPFELFRSEFGQNN